MLSASVVLWPVGQRALSMLQRKASNYAIKRDLRRNTGFKPSFQGVGPLFWLLGAKSMKYETIEQCTLLTAEAAISSGDYDSLAKQIISISLHEDDLVAAQNICARVAELSHPVVRGNAVLGFGHLARRSAILDKSLVSTLINKALNDADPYVRGQADAAAGDIEHYLGWRLRA
jgi:hypothetical protein